MGRLPEPQWSSSVGLREMSAEFGAMELIAAMRSGEDVVATFGLWPPNRTGEPLRRIGLELMRWVGTAAILNADSVRCAGAGERGERHLAEWLEL